MGTRNFIEEAGRVLRVIGAGTLAANGLAMVVNPVRTVIEAEESSIKSAVTWEVVPELPGNCITGESEGRSEEWFMVEGETFLRYGGKGTEVASGVIVLDQGMLEGTYPSAFYVTQYENADGETVIHYCSVVNPDTPLPSWGK